MPAYDFKCDNCNSVVELRIIYGATDTPLCTTCNGTMTKVWTAPAVHFKGGGWGGQ
jgi:putative FmdB family regulatory protein